MTREEHYRERAMATKIFLGVGGSVTAIDVTPEDVAKWIDGFDSRGEVLRSRVRRVTDERERVVVINVDQITAAHAVEANYPPALSSTEVKGVKQ